jgi:hypothetical protein
MNQPSRPSRTGITGSHKVTASDLRSSAENTRSVTVARSKRTGPWSSPIHCRTTSALPLWAILAGAMIPIPQPGMRWPCPSRFWGKRSQSMTPSGQPSSSCRRKSKPELRLKMKLKLKSMSLNAVPFPDRPSRISWNHLGSLCGPSLATTSPPEWTPPPYAAGHPSEAASGTSPWWRCSYARGASAAS